MDVPLNVVVPVPGVNVPLLVQSPPTDILSEFASSVPDVMVTLFAVTPALV